MVNMYVHRRSVKKKIELEDRSTAPPHKREII